MSSHYISSHFGGSHYLSSHYGREVIEVPPEMVHPPGMGPEERAFRQWVEVENELIFAVILAFLDIKDR